MDWEELDSLIARDDVTAADLARLAFDACGWLIEPATVRGALDVHTASLELSLAVQLVDDPSRSLAPIRISSEFDELLRVVSSLARAAAKRCSMTVDDVDAAMLLESAARRLERAGA